MICGGRCICRCRCIRFLLWVHSSSFVGNISNISVVMVRGVRNMLGTAIRKSNGVRSSNNASSISSLGSIEVSFGVVISNSVLVSVGLILASRLNIGWGSSIGRGGSIGRGSMDNRGMVDNRGNSNSMGNRVVNSMSNWVGNDWVMDSMSYWVGNNSMVSKSKVRSMAGMRDNSTTMVYHSMGRYIRGGGSGSKAKESGNNKSLHF